MRIAITGSSGFIGKELVKHLDQKGHSVLALTRENSQRSNHKIINYESLAEIESVLNESDVLIHGAWKGSDRSNRNIKEIQEKNIQIADNLIKVVPYTNIKKVLIVGSQEEFGNTDRILNDDSSESPETEYGKAKVKIRENFFKLDAITIIWSRLFSVYGPGDTRDWIITQSLKALAANQEITFGPCALPWSLTHVSDAVNGLLKSLDLQKSSVLNIADKNAQPLFDSLLLLQKIAGKNKLFSFTNYDFKSKQLIRNQGIIDELGWECQKTLKTGFEEILGLKIDK
jgi:nucleoside-diphosphate-sugar epimerase